jgi:hypothetical protein
MKVTEEREWALRLVHPEVKKAVATRGYGLLAQLVFFVLTAIGVLVFYQFTDAKLVTAALCLILAEFLILGRRWFFTGVEAALWIGGLLAALQALPNTGAPEAKLLIAGAFALAGARVRQPLFGAVAAYFVTDYLEARFDLGTVAAIVIGAGALAALWRTWKRPTTEWLFVALVVGMPFVAAEHADVRWRPMTLALAVSYAAAALGCGIARRHHGMFAGAAAGAIVAGITLHDLLDPPKELSLAVAGTLLMTAAFLVSRALRGRTRGFVMTPVELSEIGDAIETMGALAAAPSAGNPPERRPEGEGGFGGAGATGDY